MNDGCGLKDEWLVAWRNGKVDDKRKMKTRSGDCVPSVTAPSKWCCCGRVYDVVWPWPLYPSYLLDYSDMPLGIATSGMEMVGSQLITPTSQPAELRCNNRTKLQMGVKGTDG